MRASLIAVSAASTLIGLTHVAAADSPANVWIQDTPAYNWHYGCYGAGSGMLFAYWDRNGYANIYTGPTAGGVAPLVSSGTNEGIVALWASRAGFDGRPTNLYGHVDDYYVAYKSTAPDPWISRGVEHEPDSIGDFIGMNQDKWTNLNNECRGNRDAWAFNFFDTSGARRVNFTPLDPFGNPIPDVQSGWRAFAAWRGYDADSFSQLLDIWSDTPTGAGFTFEDLRREIDAGRPVLLHLQELAYARDDYNPDVHAVLAVGYEITAAGARNVRVRFGWTANVNVFDIKAWSNTVYLYGDPPSSPPLYPRGAIGLHFKSVVTNILIDDGVGAFEWHGPSGVVSDSVAKISWTAIWHVVEAAPSPDARFSPVSTAAPGRRVEFNLPTNGPPTQVYRLRRLEPVYVRDPALRTAARAALPAKWGPTNLLYDLDLESIGSISASSAGITNLWGLQAATGLTNLIADNNSIHDIAPLLACRNAGGLPAGSYVNLTANPLSGEAISNQIPALIAGGVTVDF